jgi:apocytochrome f
VAVSAAAPAEAYPIFAQQNYANPREATGKIACANCHLQGKYIDVRTPHEVLPDTIFKVLVEVPNKYEKRVQPIADGSKASLNVGAIAIMPKGFKLAPKDRLPKALKKEMKGLAWSPYSKEKPNIVVAGPVPGKIYETLVLPILAPDPNTDKEVIFDKYEFHFGGNRGRGQVYPEGNVSNVNVFNATAAGTVTAIEPENIVITKDDGTTVNAPIGKGATIVVEVGEMVKKDEPLTTNPNVGGFGQEDREITLQDMNRVYAYCALATSMFLAQLAFVLKKKQFEKVQLAEGF